MQQEEFFDEVESLATSEAEAYLQDVKEALKDYFIEQPRLVDDEIEDENFAEILGRELSDLGVRSTANILMGQIQEGEVGEYFEWLQEYRDLSIKQTHDEEWITQYDSEAEKHLAEEVQGNIVDEDPVSTIIDSVFIPVYESVYRG